MPPEVYGPFGALVVLGLGLTALGKVVAVLWKEHQSADLDDRMQRDTAMTGWKDQTAATGRLTDEIAADRRERSTEQKAIDDALRRIEDSVRRLADAK